MSDNKKTGKGGTIATIILLLLFFGAAALVAIYFQAEDEKLAKAGCEPIAWNQIGPTMWSCPHGTKP